MNKQHRNRLRDTDISWVLNDVFSWLDCSYAFLEASHRCDVMSLLVHHIRGCMMLICLTIGDINFDLEVKLVLGFSTLID